MAGAGSKITLKLVTIAVSIPIGIAMRKATDRIFTATRPESKFREVDDAGVDWTDALVWAAISSVGIAISQLVTRKAAEETFRVITGSEPPPQPLSKLQKKAAKKANQP